MQLIECKNVWKIYGEGKSKVEALKGINLKIKKGERIAIMGPSGCGKSTLLNMLGCLDKPTKGKLFLESNDISNLSDDELADVRGKKIGFVFQFFNLIPTLTALKNISLPTVFQGNTDEGKAREMLKGFGLKERIEHRPAQLSGGEQQRVAIARALANNPEIILADEPTGNLDSKTGKEIIELLIKLNKEKNITLVMVTHEQNIARQTKRIIYLKDGKIVKEMKR